MRNQWQDDALDLARSQTDPLADEAVAEVFATQSLESVNRVLESLRYNRAPLPDSTPAVLRRYLDATRVLPSWARLHSLRHGHELFRLFSPQIGLGLLCGSLPEGYAAVNVANLLALTKGMGHMAERRLSETAQFLLDVCAPGAFAEHGCAIRSIQKVRLLHAAVRIYSRRHAQWRPAWGEPINQEDMLGTILGFSIVPLDGLRRLGIHVEPSMEEAFLHLWCVAGAMLGVREDLLPETPAEARWLMEAGRRRHYGPSAPGRWLTKTVVNYIGRLLPWPFAEDTATELIHFFVGPKIAEHLGIQGPRAPSLALRALGRASSAHGWVATKGPHGREVAARASRLVSLSDRLSSEHATRFLVPPTERQHWTLNAVRRRTPRRRLPTPWPATVSEGGRREAGRVCDVGDQGLQVEVERSRLQAGARITIELALEGLRACELHVRVRQARSLGQVTVLGCEFSRSPGAVWQEYLGMAAARPTTVT